MGSSNSLVRIISEKYKDIKFDFEYNIEGFDNGGRIVVKVMKLLFMKVGILQIKFIKIIKKSYSIIKEYLKKEEIDYNKLNKEKAKELQDNLLV